MAKIKIRELKDIRGNPRKLAAYLGELAPFVLPQEDLKRFELVPHISRTPGSAMVLVVWQKPIAPLPEGFAIPMRWIENTSDSSSLPAAFASLAGKIRSVLGVPDGSYGLWLGEGLEDLDLSELDMEADSAFAPLAGALLLLQAGGEPRPWVFSTGAWREGRIVGVGGIDKKMAAVRALEPYLNLPSGQKIQFWVPRENEDEARSLAPAEWIYSFPYQEKNIKQTFAGFLAALDTPPDVNDLFERRLEYANRFYIATNNELRNSYYEKNLIFDLADKMSPPFSWERGHGRLATVAGPNYLLTQLGLLSLSPEWVCMLHSDDHTGNSAFRKIQTSAKGWKVQAQPVKEQLSDAEGRKILERLIDFLKEEPNPLRRAVDITPGTKEMTALLFEAARICGSRVLYIRHETIAEANRPRFGTEKWVELGWLKKK